MHLYREGHRQRSRILYVFRSPGGCASGARRSTPKCFARSKRNTPTSPSTGRTSASTSSTSRCRPSRAGGSRRSGTRPSSRPEPRFLRLLPMPPAQAPSHGRRAGSDRGRHARRSDRVSRTLVRDHPRAHPEADLGSRAAGSAAGADRTAQSRGVDRCRSDRRRIATGVRSARALVTSASPGAVVARAPSGATHVPRHPVPRHPNLERRHRKGRARRWPNWGHGDPSCSSWPTSWPR